MTIPKRDKRKRRVEKPSPPLDKDIKFSPMDKMVRNYPKICPVCRTQTYSSMCICGRVTIINKGG